MFNTLFVFVLLVRIALLLSLPLSLPVHKLHEVLVPVGVKGDVELLVNALEVVQNVLVALV